MEPFAWRRLYCMPQRNSPPIIDFSFVEVGATRLVADLEQIVDGPVDDTAAFVALGQGAGIELLHGLGHLAVHAAEDHALHSLRHNHGFNCFLCPPYLILPVNNAGVNQ
jgi:hypothetical protein